jgi:hypothetical protein
MFVIFSAGFCTLVTHLHRSLTTWAKEVMPAFVARSTAAILIAMAIVFLLTFTPWIREGLRTYQRKEGSFAGTYHHGWRTAVQFVSAHRAPSDIVIASAPGLATYYGVDAPLYYLANDSTDVHLGVDLRDKDGRTVDYIAGAPMILDLATLQQLVSKYPSGWLLSERFRFNGSRTLPQEIIQFVENNFDRLEVPDETTMVVWHWGRFSVQNTDNGR